MRAAILSIGTELTRGELVNSNATWLSDRLTAMGCEILEHAVVPDDSERIGATLSRFGQEVKLVVSTGGLGPTSDDLTAEAVAALLGEPLQRHVPSLERIEARYRALGRPMPAPNAKQADLPRSAEVLLNEVGTAPAFRVCVGHAECYFLPGVPREMRHLFDAHLEPALRSRVTPESAQVHIRSYGLRESEVAERLADLEPGGAMHQPEITLGYRAHFPEIEVKVLARAADPGTARQSAEAVAAQVRQRLAGHAYGGRADRFEAHVGQRLRAAGLKLAVAESCTGGLLGKLLTDAPGSSDFLLLDAVTYSNAAKQAVLGVGADLLEAHGAVSLEVAAAMAEGALERSGADLAVATTGIAGPDGGSADKPVGTVCFGLARRGRKTVAERRHFSGERERVRLGAAYAALELLLRASDGRAAELQGNSAPSDDLASPPQGPER
ncbi:MAG: competence/damage-inducible protein A [Myxococcales bacterium]|nr:competence/damage-inducible protein A [Myxococcales bacterium]